MAVVLGFVSLLVFTGCGGAGTRTVSESNNWSGYALDGHYTQVSASWVQPPIDCATTPRGHADLWVGLDGYFGSETVEQIGTTAYCVLRTPQYHGWDEPYPEPPGGFPNPVKPGDKISASVTADRDGEFTLVLADPSEGWTRRTQVAQTTAKLTSAEVIAEAPSYRKGHPFPLGDFGTVSFTGATAGGKSFGDLNGLHPIDMIANGKLKAAPGSMANGAFAVTWKHS